MRQSPPSPAPDPKSAIDPHHHDIEADWNLLDTCNYRCGYCFFSAEHLGRKLVTHAEPEAWAAAFERTGLRWLLHLTGGEPSIYPGFVDLCAALTRRNLMSFNSNLTHRSLGRFAEAIDPQKVMFINAGLHPAERRSRKGEEIFRANLMRLQAAGFTMLVTVVATPDALAGMDHADAVLAGTGLAPIPKLLRGRHAGKRFPAAYSDADRAAFRRYAARARDVYAPILAAVRRPSIFAFDDDRFLGGVPDYRGRDCLAGRDFVSIDPRGRVFRCSAQDSFGALLDGSFRRAAGSAPCETRYCYYFCEKYAAPAALESGATPDPASEPRILAQLPAADQLGAAVGA